METSVVIVTRGDSPLLGGPGYLDAISLAGLFAIIFGLAIDYEVFLISRLLEGRARTGTTEGAIHYGLEKTGTIITGAEFGEKMGKLGYAPLYMDPEKYAAFWTEYEANAKAQKWVEMATEK